jgi:hypothetical protein
MRLEQRNRQTFMPRIVFALCGESDCHVLGYAAAGQKIMRGAGETAADLRQRAFTATRAPVLVTIYSS